MIYAPMSQFTDAPDLNELLDSLLSKMQMVLGRKLVGLYLYGSLVAGDFDKEISDIDLLAVTSSNIDNYEFERLNKMHNDLVSSYKQWENRIEVAYVSVAALKTYKSSVSTIAVISPGEPFHLKEAGIDWLINWYNVREKGVVLFGTPPKTVIDTITQEEFFQAVKNQAREWRDWIQQDHSRPYQAYAILTMCRALYAYTNGEQVSKKQAALWAQKELPEWSSTISKALKWREAYREKEVDHGSTLPETQQFVHFVVDKIVEETRSQKEEMR